MLILPNVTAKILPDGETIVSIGEPKCDSSSGELLDIAPKIAYKIGNPAQRAEYCERFENARRKNLPGTYVLANESCPMRGFQGGAANLINGRYLAVIQRDNYGQFAYTLGVPSGRSDLSTDPRDFDGEFRPITEGIEEILFFGTDKSRFENTLFIPKLICKHSKYQKSIDEIVRDEAFRLSKSVHGFDGEKRYETDILSLPSNSVTFKVKTPYGVNSFEGGISFEPENASFEVLKVIGIKFDGLSLDKLMFADGQLMSIDGESKDEGYDFLFRNVHLLDLNNDGVKSYSYNKRDGKVEVTEGRFGLLKQSIIQERKKLGEKIQHPEMFIDEKLIAVLDSFGYKHHKG
jgi:hypothetical protein